MSLDVYLDVPGRSEGGTGIYIREKGAVREISAAEWADRFPGSEPVVGGDMSGYWRNITHNLGEMADAAGIYYALWCPHELMDAEKFKRLRALEAEPLGSDWYEEYRKIEDSLPRARASDLIGPLSDGLATLKADPEKFKALNPRNGWGDYAGLVEFVEEYLGACKRWPHAEVRVSK